MRTRALSSPAQARTRMSKISGESASFTVMGVQARYSRMRVLFRLSNLREDLQVQRGVPGGHARGRGGRNAPQASCARHKHAFHNF